MTSGFGSTNSFLPLSPAGGLLLAPQPAPFAHTRCDLARAESRSKVGWGSNGGGLPSSPRGSTGV